MSAPCSAGIQLGIMQACLDVVLPYVRERTGSSASAIGAFQLMQAKIADMYVALNSARAAMSYAVAQRLRRGADHAVRCGRGDPACVRERLPKVAGEAVQALGGAGYTKDWPVERYPGVTPSCSTSARAPTRSAAC